MLRKLYFSTKSFLSSLLFPRICVGCGKEVRWICDECLKTIDIIRSPYCPECRRDTEIGEFCSICQASPDHAKRDRNRFNLDGIFICANFGEGVLKEAIHQFKYNHMADSGGVLGKIMAAKLKSVVSDKQVGCRFDLVVPVPLHKKRLRQRGFNQSEILSRELMRILTNYHEWGKVILANNILIRKKYTTPQAELDREERLNNLKGIFEFVGNRHAYSSTRNSHGCSLQDKNILLVDDVTTTGATLEECAKILKQNGAKSVWGIVLAKGK